MKKKRNSSQPVAPQINNDITAADPEAAREQQQEQKGNDKPPLFYSYSNIPAPPPTLDEEDTELFRLVGTGSTESVLKLLDSGKIDKGGDYNEKIDENGNTIWHVAVHRKDEELLRQLLKFDMKHLYDLLLHAIEGQNFTIITIIVETIRDKHPDVTIPSQLNRWKYSKFSKDITPIILSSQLGNYNLIKYFYGIGEDFQPIHTETSAMNAENSQDVSKNFERLHEYEARASPEMFCYQTHVQPDFDPFREGFRIINELKRVSKEEHEFYNEYQLIRGKLKKFLCSVLDECKSTADMKLLLTQKDGFTGSTDHYPRLMTAMENKFHDFVIHRHCQKILYMHWAGDSWPDWRAKGSWWKCLQLVIRFFLTPFICLWLYIDIFSDWGRFFQAPVNRWINHFISYIYFMIILGWEAYLESREEHANAHHTPSIGLEILIILFVLGHIVSVVAHIMASPKTYFCVSWHWYDLITISFFLLTFGCWLKTWYNEYHMPLRVPRSHWVYYDSVLVGEAMFAVSIVLAYGRFMRYFQLSDKTGPLQIAMANMIEDISIFIFIFAVLIMSFALGFSFLYSPFHGVVLTSEDDCGNQPMTESFTSFPKALYTLYWGTLSMGPPESADIMIWSMNPEKKTDIGTLLANKNSVYITEIVGKALWMFYHLLGPMILMNMLTGYMGNTFTRIEENMDATWKYNRSQVWVYYMRNTVLPAPFNLLPTLGQLYNVYTGMKKGRKGPQKDDQNSSNDKKEKEIRTVRYYNLVRTLTQRYLRSKLSKNATGAGAASQEDVQNIYSQVGKIKTRLLASFPSSKSA